MATVEGSKAFGQGFYKGFMYSIGVVFTYVWALTMILKPVWIVHPSIVTARHISARVQNMATYCNKHFLLITHSPWLTIPKMKSTLYLCEFLVRAQPGIRLAFALLPLLIVIKSMLTCLSYHTGAADLASSAVPSGTDKASQETASGSRRTTRVPNNKATNIPEEVKAEVKVAYDVTSSPIMSSACRDESSQKYKRYTQRSNHKQQAKVDPETNLSEMTI